MNRDIDIDKELADFERSESKKLGLDREQWTEQVNTHFTGAQRPHTTLLVSGLTIAHDHFVAAALSGLGYKVQVMDAADNAALQFGKEFGNRAQCNPTYFTVGNLVKHLVTLRESGVPTKDIIENYVFLTAGACGPCRFGTYVTEYRKALRDSGFDGFRVLLFQQQGGIKQATGDELGLKIDAGFAYGIVRAIMAGDVLNLVCYRLRPYEVVPGSTNEAMAECKRILYAAFSTNSSVIVALVKCRRLLRKVAVDRTVPKPKVSIIGEFWAMTTEGEGNYDLHKFLEAEGAEVDIQSITNWILFMVWENKHDTQDRIDLRGKDGGRKGLEGKDPTKKLWGLAAADVAIRVVFQSYANAIGLHGYHLPDMDEVARLASAYYDNDVRGGEGHMEVGKLIHFVEDKVNHLTISVKPFGCMPSSGVSDGVQSLITTKWPDALFLPIETTGDGKVNIQSRVQMMLFKAREKARAEFDEALVKKGLTEATFKAKVAGSRWWSRGLHHPKHKAAGVATNLVHAV